MTRDRDGGASDLCLITPGCTAVARDYRQPDVAGGGGGISL